MQTNLSLSCAKTHFALCDNATVQRCTCWQCWVSLPFSACEFTYQEAANHKWEEKLSANALWTQCFVLNTENARDAVCMCVCVCLCVDALWGKCQITLQDVRHLFFSFLLPGDSLWSVLTLGKKHGRTVSPLLTRYSTSSLLATSATVE